ncbi:MAG: cysteine desulfurase family protein, partial [Treponemataceae bacterium]
LSQSLQLSGNPSSRHAEGRAARRALEDARARCAVVLGVDTKTLFFTSGGTESNNLVLQSNLFAHGERGIAISPIEHPSVLEPALRLKKLGVSVTSLQASADGRIGADTLRRSLMRHPENRMLAIMGVNNETGAVMDIPLLVPAARETTGSKGIHFHCDAVQALGKVPIHLHDWDVDSASFSAHKIGGPRGIGILYARKPFHALYSGGEQENGVRAGTENLFGVLAFTAVLEKYASCAAVATNGTVAAFRWARLIAALRSIVGCRLIPADRTENDERFSPYILQVSFSGVPGEVLVRAMDDAGFSISTGSACSSNSKKRPVLEAMGLDEKTAFEAVRLSQGNGTTDEDIDALIDGLRLCVRSLR